MFLTFKRAFLIWNRYIYVEGIFYNSQKTKGILLIVPGPIIVTGFSGTGNTSLDVIGGGGGRKCSPE